MEVHEELGIAILLVRVVGEAVEIKTWSNLGAAMRHGRDVYDS